MGILESGAMPTHVADASKDRPAYVVEARYGTLTMVSTSQLVPAIAEREMITGPLKHKRMWQMHPIDSYLLAASKEWDSWSKTIKSMGYSKEHPIYPYTQEVAHEFLRIEAKAAADKFGVGA